ncbi:MAG: hypothetical protein AAF840_18575, partial [Bacteroidota bacterium]
GSAADINGTVIFQDGGGPDPDFGIAPSGGTFGVTTNDPCGVGTPGINSFASLFGACPPGGNISAEICITDHALADLGTAANVSFLFPNPVVCGCTNPLAVNYNPLATVDDGSCIDQCDDYSVQPQPGLAACSSETNILSVNVQGGSGGYNYMWSVSPATGFAFLGGINSPTPTFGPFPPGFFGSYTFTVEVTDILFGCVDQTTFTVDIVEAPPVSIDGPLTVCSDGSAVLTAVGGPFVSYTWNVYGTPAPGGQSITIPAPPGGPGSSGQVTVSATDANGCTSESPPFVITSQPDPFVEVIPTPLCQGGTAVLAASPPIYTQYAWSNGSIQPTTTIGLPGMYTVTVTDATGCTAEATYEAFFTPPNPV